MAGLGEIKCESGLFIFVNDFAKDAKTATDTSVYLLDLPTLKIWFEKGVIDVNDRLFCVAEEFEIKEQISKRVALAQRGKIVMESVI